jgi:hypothetical protein
MSPATTGVFVTPTELERLIDAMTVQHALTSTGDRSGYGQELNDELTDIRSLIAKRRAAR